MSSLHRAVAPHLAYAFITFIGRTSRIRYFGLEHLLRVRKPGQGYIYSFWHQRQVLFTYTHRDLGASVLVSKSTDGDIIAETMRLSRIGAVRGSSSRRASGAARELCELLERGGAVGVTPDGPRGPARRIKNGVLYLAQKTGCPILPITNATTRRIVLRGAWDDFHFPLPFSTIHIGYGRPLLVGPDDDLEAKAEELRLVMDEITEKADRLAETACS